MTIAFPIDHVWGRRGLRLFVLRHIVLIVNLTACGIPAWAGDWTNNSNREPIRPIPQSIALNSRKVALGATLFSDPILSHDNTISCASCHALDSGGTDHRSHSVGIYGKKGVINAPTVFNSGLHTRQFWDGRANSLEEQIDGPTHSELEMGSSWEEILKKLSRSSEYTAQFEAIYPDGVRRSNIRNALAEFERSLITPNSRFDRFLRGETNAISDEEKTGYQKFKSYGCVSCHQGVSIGGNIFQPLGVMGDYFGDRGNITKSDMGRFNVTGLAEDKFVFKVPTLRNVALTGPYFHDGSAKTLEEAVETMAKYQLGCTLPPQDVKQIVLFLNTLTGKYNDKLLQ